MDGHRFDGMVRTLANRAPSRRGVLRTLAGGAAGLALTRLGLGAGATQEATNHVGCRHVDRPCRRSRQCCSGRCKGKKDGKTCRPHNVGGCTRARAICKTGSPEESNCNPAIPGNLCVLTTGKAPFCASGAMDLDPPNECHRCRRDRDCLRLGYPKGSACVIFTGVFGGCAVICPETGGRACVHPGN